MFDAYPRDSGGSTAPLDRLPFMIFLRLITAAADSADERPGLLQNWQWIWRVSQTSAGHNGAPSHMVSGRERGPLDILRLGYMFGRRQARAEPSPSLDRCVSADPEDRSDSIPRDALHPHALQLRIALIGPDKLPRHGGELRLLKAIVSIDDASTSIFLTVSVSSIHL